MYLCDSSATHFYMHYLLFVTYTYQHQYISMLHTKNVCMHRRYNMDSFKIYKLWKFKKFYASEELYQDILCTYIEDHYGH